MYKDTVVVIPTYNEEKNIRDLIYILLQKLPNVSIYIIDDSPNNLTMQKIPKKKNIFFKLRKNKSGRGSAVLYGFKKAISKKKFKYFIEMDADFSHNPKEIIKNLFILKKKKLDLLIASRYLSKSKITNWSLLRKTLSFSANILATLLLKVPVSDYTNGFRFYSKKSVKLILKKCGKISDGFIILSEILFTIHLNNLKIDQTYTTFVNRKRGKSSVNLFLILKSLIGIFVIYFNKKNYIK